MVISTYSYSRRRAPMFDFTEPSASSTTSSRSPRATHVTTRPGRLSMCRCTPPHVNRRSMPSDVTAAAPCDDAAMQRGCSLSGSLNIQSALADHDANARNDSTDSASSALRSAWSFARAFVVVANRQPDSVSAASANRNESEKCTSRCSDLSWNVISIELYESCATATTLPTILNARYRRPLTHGVDPG
ncbi:hypothetical protein GGF47_001645 [Coemansia sp. RSA 2524]|nr:hypothetical protein GGF47_001645 [Coemansia sp. RSA 2524]